ncbi:hypothetical protein HS088_TW12G00846 [Tripterygium wilfordii]|uniref:Uncharacterized protein n=1 Tax=Tripterygium wilfordii TaxID=458696 RepID=A0A7J7CZW9_TRIWF|nr:hypothetical protein HS088_TW12G00846 [Tripterygium wilfordii]
MNKINNVKRIVGQRNRPNSGVDHTRDRRGCFGEHKEETLLFIGGEKQRGDENGVYTRHDFKSSTFDEFHNATYQKQGGAKDANWRGVLYFEGSEVASYWFQKLDLVQVELLGDPSRIFQMSSERVQRCLE